MRPLAAHLCALALPLLLGVGVFLMELIVPGTGGFFPRYAITKLVWLGIVLYGALSSVAVLVVFGLQLRAGRRLTGVGVMFTHAVPVGLVGVAIALAGQQPL